MTEEPLAKLLYEEYARQMDVLEPARDTIDNYRGEVVVLDRIKPRPKWNVLITSEKDVWLNIARSVLVKYSFR